MEWKKITFDLDDVTRGKVDLSEVRMGLLKIIHALLYFSLLYHYAEENSKDHRTDLQVRIKRILDFGQNQSVIKDFIRSKGSVHMNTFHENTYSYFNKNMISLDLN